ncbi:hypothetical protein K492DRAFT_171120 [Lichtheimia hyalospora FSU 10163]|nr:hypothetical protein K492DRAFT_171120 [Lichtheimia hyalospora FSU 10163]
MGGGDLNLKKSWHPATLKNQERVWKEERKHAEEQHKIEQMKKELMEERQLQELQRLQEESGQRQRSDRLDWMYAAPNQGAGGGGNTDEMEEYLLGKKSVDSLIRDKNSKESVASSAAERFAISNANANNERDIQSKIREDPLLMIKKREQQSLRAIVDNPLKLKELRKEKKDKKKKKKKHEHDHSSHRSSRHHDEDRKRRSRDYDDDRVSRHRRHDEDDENRKRRRRDHSEERYDDRRRRRDSDDRRHRVR